MQKLKDFFQLVCENFNKNGLIANKPTMLNCKIYKLPQAKQSNLPQKQSTRSYNAKGRSNKNKKLLCQPAFKQRATELLKAALQETARAKPAKKKKLCQKPNTITAPRRPQVARMPPLLFRAAETSVAELLKFELFSAVFLQTFFICVSRVTKRTMSGRQAGCWFKFTNMLPFMSLVCFFFLRFAARQQMSRLICCSTRIKQTFIEILC